jgi:hypothetical protein
MSPSDVFLPLTAATVSLLALAVSAEWNVSRFLWILPLQLPRQEMSVEMLVFYPQNIRAVMTGVYTACLS